MKLYQRNILISLFLLLLILNMSLFASSFGSTLSQAQPTPQCVFDPLLTLLTPATRLLDSAPPFKALVTALNSLLIDLSIVVTGMYMIFTGEISSMMSILIFFILRAISLNVVSFPNPEEYIFEDPGIPTYFVFYGKVNDLYFSGHAGSIFALLVDGIFNGRPLKIRFFSFFLCFTLSILLIEQIHWGNDIIIGMTAGALSAVFANKFKFSIVFSILEGFAAICEKIEGWLPKKKTIEEKEFRSSDSSRVHIREFEFRELKG